MRRDRSGKLITKAELRSMAVATPAVENAVRQAAQRMEREGLNG